MKKYLPFDNQKLWKDSVVVAFAMLGGIDLLGSISAISIINFVCEWWMRLLTIIGFYVVIFILVFVVKVYRTRNEIVLDIRGMKVIVKEGDIFKADGWKLIPFNENFDTQVDDVIIAHSSLNGKYIDSLDDDGKEALKCAITADDRSPLSRYRHDESKTSYELGTIKTYQDIMMLALAHSNAQNEAYLTAQNMRIHLGLCGAK